MGNVNGREDGSSPSGEEGHAHISNTAAATTASFHHHNRQHHPHQDGAGHDDIGDGEFMGASPPPSPRAAGSPLMFTPQVPVVPLQRPDEMQQQQNMTWMHNNTNNTSSGSGSGLEEISNEQKIPTMITWSYDGNEVAVEGSWDNWKTRKALQRSGKDFSIMKVLASGVYQYRFIVDGQWRYAPDLPWSQDEAGNSYNILDLQDYVPEDTESISGFEPPESPESSYNSYQLGGDDFAKEPPIVPPHLSMTLLNNNISNNSSNAMEMINHPSARPQHVVLNHLYMQKGRNSPSVVALGSTHRFLAKYVTVVLYKSIQR
jgi:5'-AMP-activated protein kinase regulatory beta subunit